MKGLKKAIIVGGGPAGSACAAALRGQGFPEVQIFERYDEGRDKPCAGGLSVRALKTLRRLGVEESVREAGVAVRGAVVIGPDESTLELGLGRKGLVIRRSILDNILLRHASDLGTTITVKTKIDRLLEHDGRIVGVGAGGIEHEADVVVVATGAHGYLGWDTRPRTKVDAIIARYEVAGDPDDILVMNFHREIMPHYVWLFPEKGRFVNVGLSRDPGDGYGTLTECLDRLIARCFPQLSGARRIGRPRGFPIVYSSRARHLTRPGAVCIGEAARLTNAFTGEGIWQALRSGIEASRAISRGDLKSYEHRARWVFDAVLAAGMGTRRFARHVSFWENQLLSPWKPVAWFTGKVLMGYGG